MKTSVAAIPSVLSVATLDKVFAAVPSQPPGERPVEISRRVGDRSRTTVRHALRDLVIAGLVEFEGPDCMRRYRRADLWEDEWTPLHVLFSDEGAAVLSDAPSAVRARFGLTSSPDAPNPFLEGERVRDAPLTKTGQEQPT